MCKILRLWWLLFLVFLCGVGHTEAYVEPRALPIYANWVFSGELHNEHGDKYGYFFQVQRDGDQFHSTSALFEAQSQQIILFDESNANIHDSVAYNWQIGHAFIRFNPINDSWVFGIKTEDKKGFNFKVDMLQGASINPVVYELRPGLKLSVSQTSRLNGHIQTGSDEQFVTAKNAWLRQIWLVDRQHKSYAFTGALCRFDDSSGLYFVKILHSTHKAISGWYNPQGVVSNISAPIKIAQDKAGHWHLGVTAASKHLVFSISNLMRHDAIIAGFVLGGKIPGFCLLTDELIGGGLI